MGRMVLIIILTFSASLALAKGQIQLVHDYQRPGGDYSNFKGTSAQECARKCEISSRCQAFDFHKSDSSCWLKDRIYQSRKYPGVISGAKTTQYSKKTSAVAVNMNLRFDTQRPGGDYDRFHVQNMQQCVDRCVHDSQCAAFDYTTSDSFCYLKSWKPPAKNFIGIVSGVKKQASSSIKKQYSAQQIKSVQRLLIQQDYNPGPADGLMGRKTKIALEKYQRDRALPVTGLIDEATLIALGIQQPYNSDLATDTGKEQAIPQRPISHLQVINVAIFPWLFDDEASSFSDYLKDSIKYHIEESDKLRLKQSYYKINRIPKLNVSGSPSFYNFNQPNPSTVIRWNQPNIPLVKQIGKEQSIDLAILGTMDIHCKWSDNCQVRQMEIMLIDLTTGEITSQEGSSWEVEARDLIDLTTLKVFRKFNQKMQDS